MYKKILAIFKKYIKKISNLNYKRKIQKEKSKLYIKDNFNKNIFKSGRNKFKFFKTKLEFENIFQEPKRINLYYYLIGLFLLASSIYLAIFSHYFSLKNIDIIRQDDLVNINIVYKSIDDFRYRPLLFINKEEVEKSIKSYQPNITDVYIRKILPDNLKIILKSSNSVFLFNLDEKLYEVTQNGVVLPGKQKENLKTIKIVGFDNLGVFEYKKVFDEFYINQILKIIDNLKLKTTLIPKFLIYYKKEAELHVIDQKETTIIFDLNKDIDIQIEKLNIFYKEFQSKIKAGIVYIDLRINEKIIYCDTTSEFQCRKNLSSIYD